MLTQIKIHPITQRTTGSDTELAPELELFLQVASDILAKDTVPNAAPALFDFRTHTNYAPAFEDAPTGEITRGEQARPQPA